MDLASPSLQTKVNINFTKLSDKIISSVICSASNTLGDMLSAGEDKASEDFLKRIGRVSAFYEESSNKHDLSTTSQSKLFARIHEL